MATVKQYHWLVRVMHGLMGFIAISLLSMGLFMVGMQDSDQKSEFYGLHKSFGVLFLLLMFVRVFAKAITDSPKSFYKTDSLKNVLEKIMYFLFYVLMFSMPLSGYLMSNASGKNVLFFGYKIPNITNANHSLASFCHSTHVYSSYVLIAMICAHIAYISYRTIVKKHNILQRMI